MVSQVRIIWKQIAAAATAHEQEIEMELRMDLAQQERTTRTYVPPSNVFEPCMAEIYLHI